MPCPFAKGTYDRYFRQKMRTRRGRFSRRRRPNLKALVTRVLMKKAETKYYDIATENRRQLYHNLGGNGVNIPLSLTSLTPWLNPWLNIAEGTKRYDRIGDKISPRGMSLMTWAAHNPLRAQATIQTFTPPQHHITLHT